MIELKEMIPIRLKKKNVTTANVRALMPCTVARAVEVLIRPYAREDTPRYCRLMERLVRIHRTVSKIRSGK